MPAAWHRVGVFLIIALVLGAAGGPVQRARASPLKRAIAAPLVQIGENTRVSIHSGTGKVRFVGTEPDLAISQALTAPSTLTSEQAARDFLAGYGPYFGLADQAQELTLKTERSASKGRTYVKFQQEHGAIPVFGGELIVQVDGNNNIVSAHGEILPDIDLALVPQIESAQAAQTGREAVAKWYQVDAASLVVSEPALWIYDPVLVGPGDGETRLVWRMEVTPLELLPLRALVLVDAQRGSISLHFNQVDTARHRLTYDANSSSSLPGTLVCDESNPTCAGQDADAIAAHVYAGHTYDFYLTHHGRDSIDGGGLTLKSTVRYCPSVFSCPYQNAFWDGVQMVYGAGFSAADDVVAHELTHGVTQYESGLYYYYQSGAINESFSDVWGEFVDLGNGAGSDGASQRWLLGEDIPGIGAIRNMKNPSAAPFYDPDRMTSSYYYAGSGDNGGVHYNSGINNKAVYLMTDGGTFNGKTVSSLGITKVAGIYYEVQSNMLVSGSDYADLYDMLYQACLNLVDSNGITAADCDEVRAATDAVEMNLQPQTGFNTDAPLCAAGQVATALFFDDLESGPGNWTFGALSGTNRWSYDTGAFTHSGTYSLYADDFPGSISDSYAAMANTVLLPANAYLHFAHAYGFEGGAWDGGVVEYSANGGAWQDAENLFEFNGYDGTIKSSSTNPLKGRLAFLDDSHGYISSRLNLAALAGQNVRFRWRMGLDSFVYDRGWWLDDIQIYTCAPLIETPPNADAGGPYAGGEGSPITLDGSGSTDTGGFISLYEWDLDNDDQHDDATGIKTTIVYSENGVYNIGLLVTDNGGYTDTITTTVTISNVAPLVEAGTDQTVHMSQTVSLDPTSFSDGGVTDTHTATIDWDDGTVVAGTVSESDGSGTVKGSHSYSSVDSYNVEVCVADDDGDTGCDSLTITVNDPPAAHAGGPYSGTEGLPIALNGFASSDSDGTISLYSWDLDNDGLYNNASGVTTTVTYTDNGAHTVGLQVTDNGDFTDTISTAVAVSNAAPVVDAGENQTVSLGDSASLDPATFGDLGVTDTHTATIDWGDGTIVPGEVSESSGSGTVAASHSYSVTATTTYTVKVCVSDDDGDTGCETLTVTVAIPPTADAGGPYSGDEGSPFTVDGSGSADTDGVISQYDWDLDSNGQYDNATGITATVTFGDSGAYSVGLQVTDNEGYTDTITTTVTISNVAPVVAAGTKQTVFVGENVSLDSATFSDASMADTHTATVDWGDNIVESATVSETNGWGAVFASHTYSSARDYAVQVCVSDDDGGTGCDSLTITANSPPTGLPNDPPRADAGGPYMGDKGSPVLLDGSGSTDSDGTISLYGWDLDNDGQYDEASGITTTVIYSETGVYTVELLVMDNNGDSHSASALVTITMAPPLSSPPVADVGGPYSGDEGSSIKLDGSGSTDTDGAIALYAWDLDNNGHYNDATGVTTTVTFDDNGAYTVGLQVTDNEGITDTMSATVSVSNVAPLVDAGMDQTVAKGEHAALDPATFIDAGMADTHTATVDWDYGTIEAGAVNESNGFGSVVASHSYVSAGAYTVQICVFDDDGEVGCDNLRVVVSGVSSQVPINAYLKSDGQSTAYDPTPLLSAPAGLYTLAATFSNVSTQTIGDLYFVVTILNDDAANLLRPADSGPGGTGGTVSVPPAALGGNGVLDPGESFIVEFEFGLMQRQGFTFTVNAYGDVAGNPPNNDGEEIRFDVAEAQLLGAGGAIYLPIIAR